MPYKPFTLSAKVMIRDKQGRYLFLKRSKISKGNPGKWDIPGGKIDAGENLEEGLLREVKEEASLVITLDRVAGAAESESPIKKVAYIIFDGSLISGEVRLSEEHDDFLWSDPKDFNNVDIPDQFRPFLQSYIQVVK